MTAEPLTAADYEEVLAGHRRLVRELDVLLNGEAGAAKQASLCDIVGQLRAEKRNRPSKEKLYEDALKHILWIKDCGIDGRDESGVYRNWPDAERDAMYGIAQKALSGVTDDVPPLASKEQFSPYRALDYIKTDEALEAYVQERIRIAAETDEGEPFISGAYCGKHGASRHVLYCIDCAAEKTTKTSNEIEHCPHDVTVPCVLPRGHEGLCRASETASLASKTRAYPAWYDEECPHCKSGRLKGECDSTLRQEIERLQHCLNDAMRIISEQRLAPETAEPHRGDNIDPKLAQEAWYHVHGLAVVEPDLPLQKAIQRVYQRCTASPRSVQQVRYWCSDHGTDWDVRCDTCAEARAAAARARVGVSENAQ